MKKLEGIILIEASVQSQEEGSQQPIGLGLDEPTAPAILLYQLPFSTKQPSESQKDSFEPRTQSYLEKKGRYRVTLLYLLSPSSVHSSQTINGILRFL
jgi:hypothetical protein